jgi:hypothetical protein
VTALEPHKVSLRKTTPVEVRPGRVWQQVAQVASRPFPTPRQIWVITVWRTVQVARVLPRLPWLLLRELAPIGLGLWKVTSAWARWCAASQYREDANQAEGNARAKAGDSVEKRRTARKIVSTILFFAAVAGLWWMWVARPWWWLVALGVIVVAALDAVGRSGRENPEFLPPMALPAVLSDNVPLDQITKAILGALDREGFEPGSVGLARPLMWDPARSEYRISLSVRDALKPEHVRSIERSIGARDYSIRNLATDTSTVRQLVIRVGDPLAIPEPIPWIPTGTRSVKDPLDLGVSAGELPFAVRFSGVMVAVVGRTGSGKSKGMLWAIIDRLSACSDVVLWGIDLQAGPALPMWRQVIQRAAYTPEDAEALLAAAQVEVDRRMQILQQVAESDDDEDDTDEWHPGLGPALVIVFDEYALAADYDGKKKDQDLLGAVERIVRTGRKVWVTLILATQKTGNSDFGSRVVATQLGVKILMACAEEDTVRLLSTQHRDAGWAPHALQPGVEGDPRDAGKCYLSSPTHDLPDIYRCYMAMTPGEVKRRARQRAEDGLPSLQGRRVFDAIDAVEVPRMLAAVESAFEEAGSQDEMPTVELLERLGVPELTAQKLAEQVRPLEPTRWRVEPGSNKFVRGYRLEDVQRVIQELG